VIAADDDTLGGYQQVHGRSDGRAYSAGLFSDDDADALGQYGASLLFIRWSADQQPDGHLESDYIARASDAAEAEAAVGRMSLMEVKEMLENLIARRDAEARA